MTAREEMVLGETIRIIDLHINSGVISLMEWGNVSHNLKSLLYSKNECEHRFSEDKKGFYCVKCKGRNVVNKQILNDLEI